MSRVIDLNCDLGESFGAFRVGEDASAMPFLTSANIACGAHAGDPVGMRTSVRLARENNVAVGAHPGYPDLQGFGRRTMGLSPAEVTATVIAQVGALEAIARAEGAALQHVKPHGALYNFAAVDEPTARAIAEAMREAFPRLILVVLAGSASEHAARAAGLRVATEAFCDRGYTRDGTLAPRGAEGELLHEPAAVAARAAALALGEPVPTIDGGALRIRADTLCLHGDKPGTSVRARAIREALASAGVSVRPMGEWVGTV
jgi:UPF0271 protein